MGSVPQFLGEAIHEQFAKQIDLVLDIGVLVSEPSTIVDLTAEPFEITRQGKGQITI
jgi:tRNA A37 threonylcarbamoyladenosine synthetase subunit TsaC/SUA5/YrdC